MDLISTPIKQDKNRAEDQLSETKLLLSAQGGSLDAFNQLVELYQAAVCNLAYWLVLDHQAAEDATQETFLKAFQRMNQFRGGSFRSWLLRIARNTCLDELRRQKRQRTDLLHSLNGEYDASVWLVDPGSIQHTVENNELKKTIHHGIRKLNSRYSHAVILVDIMTLDYAEAAAIMNVPIGTIKSRVARARMALRSELTLFQPEWQQRNDREFIG